MAYFWDRIKERAEETIECLKKGVNPPIRRYALHINSKCNMVCNYCNTKRNSKEMDRDLFRQLCKKAGKQGVVHVTGGEPLLTYWLEDEIYNQINITNIALNSNLLVMPKLKTLESIFRLKTSLDDYEANTWNKTTGGNFFNRIVKHIQNASKIVKNTSICFTATHQNSYKLQKFLDFCTITFPEISQISVSFYKGDNIALKLMAEDIYLMFEVVDFMKPESKQLFLESHSPMGDYYPENISIPCYLSLTERLYDEYGREFYCSHLYRDGVEPPGNPSQDYHCIIGCNKRFRDTNHYIHTKLMKNDYVIKEEKCLKNQNLYLV